MLNLRLLFVAIASLGVTACSSLPETVTGTTKPNYRYYDPCIRCGESWVSLPNREFNALYEAESQPGFQKSDYRRSLARMYGPDWESKFPELAARYAEN